MYASFTSLFRLTGFIFILFVSSLCVDYRAYAQTFENYSSYGTEVDRSPNRKKRKSCSKRYYCGPTTTIELTMHGSGDSESFPDEMLGLGGYDTGESGTFEQMLQMGEAHEKGGMEALMIERIKRTADAEDAEKIVIVIPMIDYGFSGTFNNINIKASKSGESLNTATKGPYGAHKGFTGSVTIEKYTPYVMTGSYSGSLYQYQSEASKDYRGPAWEPIPVKLVATGTVSGEFNILSPWMDDDRIKRSFDHKSAVMDPMREDIKRQFDRLGLDMDDEIDRQFDKVDTGNNRTSGGASSSSDIYDGCNCSCNFTDSATPKCQTLCAEAFDVCKGDRYTPPVRQSYIDNGELQPKLDALASEIENLAPELQELAPELKELAPALRELGPEIEKMGEDMKLKPGEKFMNLDQDIIDRVENNTLKPAANMREQFIALVEQQLPGPDYAPFRENMIKEFDAAPDDKSRLIMFISVGGKE